MATTNYHHTPNESVKNVSGANRVPGTAPLSYVTIRSAQVGTPISNTTETPSQQFSFSNAGNAARWVDPKTYVAPIAMSPISQAASTKTGSQKVQPVFRRQRSRGSEKDQKSYYNAAINKLSSIVKCMDVDGKGQKYHRRYQKKINYHSHNDYETDWDLPPKEDLRGPILKRGPPYMIKDDMNFYVKDLFPCFTEFFEMLGCYKAPDHRRGFKDRGRDVGHHIPQIESVCLDCGHVLQNKQMDKSIMRDDRLTDLLPRNDLNYHGTELKHGLGTMTASLPFNFGYGNAIHDWNKKDYYDGYKDWTYYDGREGRRHREKANIPHFEATHPRMFESKPRKHFDRRQWAESEYLMVDGKGVVVLPNFNVQDQDQHLTESRDTSSSDSSSGVSAST